MPTYSYETNEQPVVRVNNCNGDVVVSGWDQPTIEITTDDDLIKKVDDSSEVHVQHSNKGIHIDVVEGDLRLRVPHGAMVQITNSDGDVHVRDVAELETTNIAGDVLLKNIVRAVRSTNLEGQFNVERCGDVAVRGSIEGDTRVVGAASVALERVEGDARIEDVPIVRLGAVEGDLHVNNAVEQCEIGHVEGDLLCTNARSLTIGHVEGDLTVDDVIVVMTGNIGGDAMLNGAFDQMTLGTVQGDLVLRAQFSPGGTYRAHVAGDAAVHLPDEANLVLQGNVVGEIRGTGVHTDHPTNMRLVWGEGEAALQLSVIGDLVIHGPSPSNVAVGIDGGEWHEGEPGVYVNSSLDLDLGGLGRDLANMGRELAASLGPRVWASKRGRKGNWRAGVGLDPAQKEQIKQQVRAGVEHARASVDRALREARVTPPAPPMPPLPSAPPTPPTRPSAPTPPQPSDTLAAGVTGATVPLQAQAAAQNTPPDRDAERLAILRMVGEGTVTPAQAEDLLAALES